MLGEDHSLWVEFKNHQSTIQQLIAEDQQFAEDASNYDRIDREIRELELQSAPIGDAAMHQLKHQRAVLKDSLYQRIMVASKS